MADELTVRIAALLAVHVGTATLFCGECGQAFMPETWEIDEWDHVGIKRHQAEQVRAALGETLAAVWDAGFAAQGEQSFDRAGKPIGVIVRNPWTEVTP